MFTQGFEKVAGSISEAKLARRLVSKKEFPESYLHKFELKRKLRAAQPSKGWGAETSYGKRKEHN